MSRANRPGRRPPAFHFVDAFEARPERNGEAMPMTPEQREMLNQRRQQVTQELAELSAARAPADRSDKTERRQELLDELDEIRHGLGEVEPEE